MLLRGCNDANGIRPDGKDIIFEVDGIEMNAWETCIEYCDKLHAFGYVLEPVYPDNFLVRNENSLENIFTIPLDNDANGRDTRTGCGKGHCREGS